MPGHRQGPPNERPNDGLSRSQRKNVAFPGKKPTHRRPAYKREWHKNWIWPVQGGKYSSGKNRNRPNVLHCIEQSVGEIRIQCDLLEQTKCAIGKNSPEFSYMWRQMVKRSQGKPCNTSNADERYKYLPSLTRCLP